VLRIGYRQPVLFGEAPVRPDCHLIAAAEIAEFGEELITKFGRRLGPRIGFAGLASPPYRGEFL